jgi:predicted ribonuclease YlaK
MKTLFLFLTQTKGGTVVRDLNFQNILVDNKSIHVLDTNIFMNFLYILKWAEEEVIIIPRIVPWELKDIAKNIRKTSEERKQAREALNEIFRNNITEDKLIEGIHNHKKCYIFIRENKKNYFKINCPDHRIISLAKDIQKMNNHGREVILLSHDYELRKKAKNKKVKAIKCGGDYFFKRNKEARVSIQQVAFA